ncbi:peroxiredoxin family protein [Mucilaginibacter endophyticus]|uniref:peroxiredoxin family protein n=1 Tax=Mucilaginibacter endophyticus TaxID=2675003 RepID=UPI000E0CFD48|nr:redoxin domain-containing protein [Mucilaginibacter endophyticus]
MKKILAFSLVLILGGGLGYMIYHIVRVKKQTDIANQNKQHLPDFSFFDLNDVKKGSEVVKPGAPVVIIYFNNDCEYCQREAKQLNANMHMLNGTQILMVSFNTVNDIKQYAKANQLDQYKQVTFLRDKELKFTHWFGNCSIPSVFVYNAQHQLVKEFYGEVKIEAIKALI